MAAEVAAAAADRRVALKLSLHRLEGALFTSMSKPFVRVHAIDIVSGQWLSRSKTGRSPVYQLSSEGKLLAPAQRDPKGTSFSSSGGGGSGLHVQPFSTDAVPLGSVQGGTQRASPSWGQHFAIMEDLPPGSVLVFEILDLMEEPIMQAVGVDEAFEKQKQQRQQLVRLAWAFLDLDQLPGLQTSPPAPLGEGDVGGAGARGSRGSQGRRLRLQLYKYRFLRAASSWSLKGWHDAVAAQELEERSNRPQAFVEVVGSAAATADLEPNAFLQLFGRVFGRGPAAQKGRRSFDAVLEVSIGKINLATSEASTRQLQDVPALPKTSIADQPVAEGIGQVNEPIPEEEAASPQKDEAEEDEDEENTYAEPKPELVKLAPHHAREGSEACALPDGLLWQITAAKRGAARLSLAPGGRFLATAAARQGGTYELKVYDLRTGRLHANCSTCHDAFVYDLCWHQFTAGDTKHAPLLLISCSSDTTVQIYEVPEDLSAGALLRPHLRFALPGHVYSVRPLKMASMDPTQLVLICAGHNFGLMLCHIARHFELRPLALPPTTSATSTASASPGARPGMGRAKGNWRAAEPGLQPVAIELRSEGFEAHFMQQQPPQMDAAQRLRSTLSSSLPNLYSADSPPDVLCVRCASQPSMPDSFYATTSRGHILLFNAPAGAAASLIRSYSAPFLQGVPIHALEVVTPQLLEGRRLNQLQLATFDDWVLIFSKDHIIRLASLQRGTLRVELEMRGMECGTFPVRGAMSPDGAYVACGSETGELRMWDTRDGKMLPSSAVPRVKLAGPILDTVWSPTHHLVACCSLADQAPPLLVFVGGDPERPRAANAGEGQLQLSAPRSKTDRQLPALMDYPASSSRALPNFTFTPTSPSPLPSPLVPQSRPSPSPSPSPLPLPPLPFAASPFFPNGTSSGAIAAHGSPLSALVGGSPSTGREWMSQWMEADTNPRSVLTLEEKKRMKAQIITQLCESRGRILEDATAARSNHMSPLGPMGQMTLNSFPGVA